MSEAFLIDQALAAVAAAQPVRLGDSIEITPQQALVHSVYAAQEAALKGWGEESAVARCSRAAISAGIPQAEVDAAIARAKELAT